MATLTVTAAPASSSLGQTVHLAIKVADDTGQPVDPATLTTTIRQPDGTASTILVGGLTRNSVGDYGYDYLPPKRGDLQASAVSTNPGAEGTADFTVGDVTVRSQLNSGYMTVAEFKAIPTRIAVDQLIVGAVRAAQDAELADVLARASAWADGYCILPTLGVELGTLGATAGTLIRQAHADADGDVNVPVGTAPKIPVQVVSVGYGPSRTAVTTLTDLTTVVVDSGTVTVGIGGYTGSWTGALQFGSPAAGGKLWVTLGLIVGWANSRLTTPAAAGDVTVTVADPTGMQPGTVLDVTDPGSEERAVVQSVTDSTVTLTAGLASAHPAGTGFTAIPADVREAVAYAACARLVTPGEASNPNPAAAVKPGKKNTGAMDDAYTAKAKELLAPYRRQLP